MSEAFNFKNEYGQLILNDPKEMSLCYGPIKQFGFNASLGINLLGQGNKIGPIEQYVRSI